MSDKISSNVRTAKFNDLLNNRWNIFAVSKHAPILEGFSAGVCASKLSFWVDGDLKDDGQECVPGRGTSKVHTQNE